MLNVLCYVNIVKSKMPKENDMSKKRTLSIEQIKSLFNQGEEGYQIKQGPEYAGALEALFGAKNKNDRPFSLEDIKKQPEIKAFNFPGVKEFAYICKLRGVPININNDNTWVNERIIPVYFADNQVEKIFNESLGLVYMLTCEIDGKEHIVKIGCSRTTFKARLGSYNCGTVNAWRTASTTNIKMLQSFLACGIDFNLYILDCSGYKQPYEWYGIISKPFATSKIYAYEDILINEFRKQFGYIPLANVQASATEI